MIKVKCEGCGISRPYILEIHQEEDKMISLVDLLKCVLDKTNASYK
jgi:hypothetical protein